jgi:hypothetical protein
MQKYVWIPIMTPNGEFEESKHRVFQKSLEIRLYIPRRGGSLVARLTVVLQSQVRNRRLPSPQLTANLLVGCHLGWHLAAGWPLWGATEEKIMRNEPLVRQKHIKKKYIYTKAFVSFLTIFAICVQFFSTFEAKIWKSQLAAAHCNSKSIFTNYQVEFTGRKIKWWSYDTVSRARVHTRFL